MGFPIVAQPNPEDYDFNKIETALCQEAFVLI
jgi:hypothetical protein